MNGYFALNKTTADLIVEITDLTRHIMSIFNIQSGFRFESEDGRAGSSRHKKDEETVKRRLRALGYLE
jgi:hypothetical protein